MIMMIYVEITSGILYIPYITKQFRNSVDDIARQICLYEDQEQQQQEVWIISMEFPLGFLFTII